MAGGAERTDDSCRGNQFWDPDEDRYPRRSCGTGRRSATSRSGRLDRAAHPLRNLRRGQRHQQGHRPPARRTRLVRPGQRRVAGARLGLDVPRRHPRPVAAVTAPVGPRRGRRALRLPRRPLRTAAPHRRLHRGHDVRAGGDGGEDRACHRARAREGLRHRTGRACLLRDRPGAAGMGAHRPRRLHAGGLRATRHERPAGRRRLRRRHGGRRVRDGRGGPAAVPGRARRGLRGRPARPDRQRPGRRRAPVRARPAAAGARTPGLRGALPRRRRLPAALGALDAVIAATQPPRAGRQRARGSVSRPSTWTRSCTTGRRSRGGSAGSTSTGS